MLCRTLFQVPFKWTLEHDQNRALDGLELREGYEYEGECTFLEMLVGLCYRMDHESSHNQSVYSPTFWFLVIIDNLGLGGLGDSDAWMDYNCDYVETVFEACNRVNNRDYLPDGKGGLFPLEYPPDDMTKVEIYYQMTQFMYENSY